MSNPVQGRRFFQISVIVMAAVVFVGFARTFFLRPLFPDGQEFAPPEPFFLYHGIVFSAWMVWLVLQTSLVQARQVQLHRTLGWLGVALASLLVVTGIYGAALAAGRPGGFMGIDVPGEAFMIVPFTAVLFFAIFVGLAIRYRQKAQYHKRFMLLATVNLLEAAIIRIPIDVIRDNAPLTSFGPALLFIVALGIHDRRTLGRVHPVTLWGGIAIALSQPIAFGVVSGTGPWLAFSRWLSGLVA